MSDQTAPAPGSRSGSPSSAPHSPKASGFGPSGGGAARGGVLFAAVLLLVDGVLAVLNGIAGIAKGDVYAKVDDYVYRFDLTTWGWIHLIVGVVLIVAAVGIFNGSEWARGLGLAMASLSIFANFLWMPYQPLWAIVAIGIDVFVIWSLLTDRSWNEE